ncbi:MAG: response regulator [Anaerolineae bacterium]|nr:response regulator [Anaerolineae bacterium]
MVDDDADFVDLCRMILTKEGYQVSAASDGQQALQMMRNERPDLVLLDIMMATPLEGVAVAREIASDPNLKTLPVVIVSSIDSSQYASLLPDDVHIPVDAWISKPIDPDHLLRTVRRFVKGR